MPSSHLILCRPLLLLPPILPSIRVFSNESTLRMRWPKYWSFSFSISPSSEHPGLISFRMDWLDLLAVQRTRKSLLQHHSSKASILWHSGFFTVQLSHPYMTTGKTIALTTISFNLHNEEGNIFMSILQAQSGGLQTFPNLVLTPQAPPAVGSRSSAPFCATCSTPTNPKTRGDASACVGGVVLVGGCVQDIKDFCFFVRSPFLIC